jgi:hypothetical protein
MLFSLASPQASGRLESHWLALAGQGGHLLAVLE